jgi:hypothetical protein
VRRVARVVGVAESTVARGARELAVGGQGPGRVRAAGAGRKRLRDRDPGLVPALLALVEPDQRGDPQSPLRWTTKSTRNLAAELTRQGHPVGADTVAALLKAEGFSLQGTSGDVEAAARDAARSASIARTAAGAQAAAAAASAATSLASSGRVCRSLQVATSTADFRAGGTVTVTVTCAIRLQDLAPLRLGAARDVQQAYTAPVDPYTGVRP